MNVLSTALSLVGGILGFGSSSENDQTIGALTQQVSDLQKSLKNAKLLNYALGLFLAISLIVLYRKK